VARLDVDLQRHRGAVGEFADQALARLDFARREHLAEGDRQLALGRIRGAVERDARKATQVAETVRHAGRAACRLRTGRLVGGIGVRGGSGGIGRRGHLHDAGGRAQGGAAGGPGFGFLRRVGGGVAVARFHDALRIEFARGGQTLELVLASGERSGAI
jgi:hypothetical protein